MVAATDHTMAGVQVPHPSPIWSASASDYDVHINISFPVDACSTFHSMQCRKRCNDTSATRRYHSQLILSSWENLICTAVQKLPFNYYALQTYSLCWPTPNIAAHCSMISVSTKAALASPSQIFSVLVPRTYISLVIVINLNLR